MNMANVIFITPNFLNDMSSLRRLISLPNIQSHNVLLNAATGRRAKTFRPIVPSASRSIARPVANAASIAVRELNLVGKQMNRAGNRLIVT